MRVDRSIARQRHHRQCERDVDPHQPIERQLHLAVLDLDRLEIGMPVRRLTSAELQPFSVRSAFSAAPA